MTIIKSGLLPILIFFFMVELLQKIRACEVCKAHLPKPPKPVIRASATSKIIIVGQAPGQKVQNSGIPWDDLSGKQLRRWLGVSPEEFYDESLFALIPMGMCYPGKGKSHDLPPRPECAPLWHPQLMEVLPKNNLTILVGIYAQKYYLGKAALKTLTDNVKAHESFGPTYFPVVHPSPRNIRWQIQNPWFEQLVVPKLQLLVEEHLTLGN